MNIRRRNLLLGAGATSLLSAGRVPKLHAQSREPIRLPVVVPVSGPAAPYGLTCRIGAELAAEYVNSHGGIMGRSLEVQIIDDQGKPQETIARARDLIAQGHKFFVGGLLSSEVLAMMPLLADSKAVALTMATTSMSITHDLYTRYLFRSQCNDYEGDLGCARLVVERYPDALNWGAILTDLATYHDTYGYFADLATKAYAAKGKKATFHEPTLAKYGTTDFHPQIAQLQSLKVDAVFHELVGSDSISFWQQARAFDLGRTFQVVLDRSAIDFVVAKAIGSSLPPNLWSLMEWYPGLYPDNPIARSLAEGATKRTGEKYPSPFLSYGHLPTLVFAETMRVTNGSGDSEQIIKAIEDAKFDTELGKIYYRREDHQMVGDVNLVKIVPQQQEPGFAVAEGLRFPGADLLEPPGPGTKFAM